MADWVSLWRDARAELLTHPYGLGAEGGWVKWVCQKGPADWVSGWRDARVELLTHPYDSPDKWRAEISACRRLVVEG